MRMQSSLYTLALSALTVTALACGGSDETNNNSSNNNSSNNNNSNNNTVASNEFDEEQGDRFALSTWFETGVGNTIVADVKLKAPFDIAAPDFAPKSDSPAASGGQAPAGAFFTAASYIGGVDPANDWTRSGWTSLDDTTTAGTGTSVLPASITCDANDVCTVPAGTYTEDMTWGPDKKFRLFTTEGPENVFIGDGTAATTLTILPGTTIYGEGRIALVIRRNAKLMAEGTAASPITFTSGKSNPGRGDWGGLIINGNAPVNLCPDASSPCLGEGESGEYGGTNAADNSGSLKYVRVYYAGTRITDEDEYNGIAFQGVGSGTTVDYIEVLQASDDGIEFFGGSVDAKHLLILGAGDDTLDWTFGYNGRIQFVVGQQAGDEANSGIEADNDKDTPNKAPRSEPTISNLTLVGNPDAPDGQPGMVLRRGTGLKLHNSVVMNFETCLDIDDDETFRYTEEEDGIAFTRVILSCPN